VVLSLPESVRSAPARPSRRASDTAMCSRLSSGSGRPGGSNNRPVWLSLPSVPVRDGGRSGMKAGET
jgi:hypothetical protein